MRLLVKLQIKRGGGALGFGWFEGFGFTDTQPKPFLIRPCLFPAGFWTIALGREDIGRAGFLASVATDHETNYIKSLEKIITIIKQWQ